ncbi:MAG: PQQ-binding-like beta-propeller repeat protein [Phycisphaerae bacterium]|nr:PQQ-binding-like beta-propeller repeat protein [Phycisphaerae bacterium]
MNKWILFCFVLLCTLSTLYGQNGTVDAWSFDKVVIRNAIGNRDIELSGAITFVNEPLKALVFSGSDCQALIKNVAPSQLPPKIISVEACVLLKQGTQYGGIIGYIQDNGEYEKGWLLGYNNTQFNFVLSSKSNERLTYLNSKSPFKKNKWHYVVATYDGIIMKLYVDGKLDNTSTVQKGDIDYPESAYYAIGAYRDNDENFVMDGQIHKINVYDKVLTADQVAANFANRNKALLEPIVFKVEPHCQFITSTQAKISWQIAGANEIYLDFGPKGNFNQQYKFNSSDSLSVHKVENLKARSVYQYRFRTDQGSVSDTYEIETAMNYIVPEIPQVDITWQGAAEVDYNKLAREILSQSKVTKGYCVILGSTSGKLAYELARQSELRIYCFDDKQEIIDRTIGNLTEADIYGARINVRQVKSLDALPLNAYFANLIVSETALTDGKNLNNKKEIERVLVPASGCFIQLDKSANITSIYKRPELKNAGSWTHQYGDASNSANSGTRLANVTKTTDLQVAWMGYPGADFGLDRNPRMPAPLAVNGRLFHQGMNRIIALDSFNGSVLWSMELPTMRRVNMPRDACNWCANDDKLFIEAGGQCVTISQYHGQLENCFKIPDIKKQNTHQWGYIAFDDNKLFGSSVKKDSAYKDFWGGDKWYDKPTGFGTGKVVSDNIFACQPATGNEIWSYAKGSIINTTITIADGNVFFIESRNPEVNNAKTGRIESDALWQNQYLVALNAATGKLKWETPVDTADGGVTFFMSYGQGKIIVNSSSLDRRYHLYAYDGTNGKLIWEKNHSWPSDNHSGHMQHHTIAGNAVYQEPFGYDLITGNRLADKMGLHEGCATYSAGDELFVYRGKARCIALWDIKTETISTWTNLRPSCWLSVMFANGMLLAPEGGGGCACGRWLETSLGFAPVEN